MTLAFILGIVVGIFMYIRFHNITQKRETRELQRNLEELEKRWKDKYIDDGYEAY